ncbi:hypothetical protein ACI2JN_10225 [Ochrobactrum teleogrylli]|uniref:Uncharacterized protein n=1 Tax=Ochrobactrum soli TaxID=2448455 RepID=A0A849KNK9_9HYPH|nr:hypothetical protein [[Ochrobactrum] soli]NNU63291.1 hypothetical protein [[Ochrobactrum] soli]
MKKLIFAALAVAFSAGAAYAENPYVGMPQDHIAQEKAFKAPSVGPVFGIGRNVDNTATATIRRGSSTQRDGSANRFGDASPSSHRK